MKKNWGAKFYIGSVSIVFCIVTILQPFAVAYAESGVGRVENVAEGITVRQNWNGSKTLTMELTDEQMEAMEPDDSDALLVDRGDAITSTSETVEAEINNDFKQNDELVTVAKDGTSISIAPIVDESNFEQEKIPKSPDDLTGSEEAESATPQNPEMPVNESEEPVQPDTQEAGLTDITNEEAENSLSPEATAAVDGEFEAIPAPEAVQEAEAAENPTPEPTAEQAPAGEPTPEVSEPSAVPVSKEDSKPELRKEGYSGSAFESVTYEGVFDPSTDLRLKARENGIKEDIIINEYTENNVFEYRIGLGGLVPRQEGQEILLSDSNGVNIARIAAPFMTDAAGAYSEDIAVSIWQDGNFYIIRYEPDSSWLTPERAYPVIVDPSVYYDSVDAASLGLEDNYVSNTSPDTVNTYNREYFRVGNDTAAINQAYIRCVIPEDIVNKSSNILIQHAQVNMYETSGNTSGNTFSIRRVESSWNSRTITWNNSPHILDKAYDTQYVNGSGWYSWNLTEMFGEYFNTFNQVENCGFALVCDANDYGDYREFVSADTPSYRMTFSMTYFEEIPNTGIRVTPYTNGVNSGSGYFDVNWNSVEGAGGYYVGIWDGKEYEYLNVGNTTSFTTRGRAIWPTTGEINVGPCRLHLNGGGAELPMIPAHLYAKNNPGSSYANDLNYYFKVVPHNGTGQAPNPGLFSEAYGKLPDTMPPNKPSAVTVNPSGYTNAVNITVSWSGITDYNNTSGSAQTTLSGGQIEYLIDSDSPAGAWKTTGKNTASGSYVFSTAGLKDGQHYIAIRGKDAAGNYGVHNYAYFYLDKTGPAVPKALSITPAGWTNQGTVSMTWSAFEDTNNLKSVEYRFDSENWIASGKTDKAFNGLPVDITSLADGEHTVSIRATDVVGNVGAAGTMKLYKDTTAPTAESITVDPDSWTISDTVNVTWAGLRDPHSGLARAEYSVAGGDWYNVLTPYVPPEPDIDDPGKGESGGGSEGDGDQKSASTSSGNDQNGFLLLTGLFEPIQQPLPLIDITNPQGLLSLFADPDGDAPPTLSETGNITAYLTGLPDGEHEIAFKVTDQLENQRTHTNTVYRDLTNPEIEIIAPVNGDIVNGMVEIWGTAADLSLDEWTLTATGDTGKSVELARSTEAQDGQIIGVLNTGAFEDHEKIELTLCAKDKAGNESLIEGIVLEVDKSAKPITPSVSITSPAKGDRIAVPSTKVDYTADYLPDVTDSKTESDDSGENDPADTVEGQSTGQQGQKAALYYIDSVFAKEKDDETSFDFDAITYPEGSSHTLTVISEDTNGQLHYSGGLGAAMLFADAFDNEDFTADKTNIDYAPSEAKLTDPSQDGEIVSVLSGTAKEIMALRLKATEETPDGTSIEYSYSIDGGHTWEPITTQTDIALKIPTKSVAVKAVLHGNGSQSPVLRAWQLEGVIEMSPVRVFSDLLREAKPFHITEPETVTLPVKEISTDLSRTDCVNQWLYEDGSLHADSFTYEAYKVQERSKHGLSAFAETKDGFIYASGMANTQLLLRENFAIGFEPPVSCIDNGNDDDSIGSGAGTGEDKPDTDDARPMPVPQGMVTSGKITAPSPVNVIRLDALAYETNAGSIVYEYSLDNKSWDFIDLNDNVALPKAAKEIYLRAKVTDGARLVSWHLEGASGTEKKAEVKLVQPPVNVVASDYGEYYEKDEQKNHILTWENPNGKTGAVECAVFFDIYKNGTLIKELSEDQGLSYLDPEYEEGAAYEVSVKHIYGDVHGDTVTVYPHESLKTSAETVLIPPPEKLDVVEFTANEYEQSQYLNDLYGGNYTFSTEPSPPKGERLLNEKLLGKNKYCAIGFEPINFNNGNFFMEQADFVYTDVGSANLNIVRTYNAQSEMTDGPFGAKWDTDFAQHLILFQDGSYGYVKADGATVYFTPNGDGTYSGNDDDYLKFAVDEINHEISIEEARGKTMVFTTTGLLKSIITDETNVTKIERDENGLMTAVIAPSGTRLGVTMDTGGHITEITLPGGAAMQYEYSGTDLMSFTDAAGSVKRYVYDDQHRMIQWYDGNGVQQVFNEYDEKDRVVFQTDAQAGEYHLEYFPDHTITTDAQGQKTEVWFDDQKRVIKQVDANGNETLTSYDEDGNVSGITQADGTLIAYEYDGNGNKTKEISPDGSFVSFVYNEDNLPVEFTDKAGNVTKYEYDPNGNQSKQINPDGSVVQFQYNAYGQKILEIDAVGNKTEYKYEGANLVETIDAKGGVTKLAYDPAGHLTSKIDASGMVTKYEYDAAGNNTKIVFADGTFMAYEYDGAGNQIAAVNPMGETTRMEYDGMNQLVRTILPDGSVQQAEYDFNGNVKKVSNALGETATYEYDANGNAISQTDAAGNRTTFEYDSMNRMTAQINAAGARTVYVYDELTGKLAKTVDADGNETQFQYDANGNQVKQINPDGTTVTTEYDSLNRPVKTTDANGGVSTIEYNPDSSIAATIDATGAKTTFAYDANGNVTKETDALGNSKSTKYDAAGKIISVTNQNGGVFRYEYDQAGQLAKTIDPLGNTEEYEYDQAANLIKTTDVRKNSMRFEYNENGQQMGAVLKNGGKTHTEYDGAGRVTKQTDALGNSTQYEYNANGQATKVTDARENSVTMEYDSLGNTVKTTGPNGISIENEYDETGRLLKSSNEQGLITEYTYDSMNRVTAQTVNGKTTEYAYDGNGNVRQVTDAQEHELELKYDKANRLTHIIYPDGTSDRYKYDELGRVSTLLPRQGMPTQYTYDAVGNILTEQNGNRIATYEYDAMGNMTARVNPDGSKISYAYDAAGNMVSQTDALGNVTQVSYDAMDWAEKIAYADGSSYENKYDLGGNVIQKTDAENAKTTFEYDAAGNVTKTTDALGNTVSYEYDALGSLTKVTDALSHATEYEYDSQGNLLSETDALGNVKKYEYTPEGWLTKITNPDGTVTTYTYDDLGQMTGEDYNGEKQVMHTYNELGLVTEMTGPEGTSKYQYDDKSQLISVTGASGDVVGYSYDDYGRKTQITYPDGRKVSYQYDDMDRLVEVRGLDGGKTTYEYDANGNRIKTKAGGIQTEYTYDAMNRVVSQRTSGETNISFAYEYDKNGYITGETRTEGETVYTRDYDYDPLGQLTSFKENDYSEKYTYDAAGNMTQKVANGVKSEMAYNAANQLTKLTSANGAVNYTYDANGNLTAKTLNGKTSTYAYDAAGKLTDYLGYDGYEEQYTYDAAGNRIEKKSRGTSARKTLEELAGLTEKLDAEAEGIDHPETDPNEWTTTEYVNDSNMEYAQVLMERTGGRTVSYEYGLERLSMYAQEGLAERKTEYVYDGRGSVAQEVSYNNAWYNYLLPFTQDTQVESHRYTPFGGQMTGKATGFGYNGEYYSAETGLQYLRMRYYEPDMMRFSQKDMVYGSIENPLSLNRYVYVYNNPVEYADRDGKKASSTKDSIFDKPSSYWGSNAWYGNGATNNYKKPTDSIFDKPSSYWGSNAWYGNGSTTNGKPNATKGRDTLKEEQEKNRLYKSAQEAFPGSQMKKSSSGYPMVLIGGQWVSFGSEASIRNTAKCLEEKENTEIWDILNKIQQAILDSLEFDAGIGMGIGVELGLGSAVLGMSVRSDVLHWGYVNGQWNSGREQKVEFSAGLGPAGGTIYQGGDYQYIYVDSSGQLIRENEQQFRQDSDLKITIADIGLYIVGGGHAKLELNISEFLKKLGVNE